MRLREKIAIVTGAAAGFGEGIARLFAREGALLVLADRDAEGVQRLAHEIGPQAVPVTADVSRQADVAAIVAATMERFGGLDIVVNNAGIVHPPLSSVTLEEEMFDRLFAVNVKSIFWMVREAVPVLRAQARGGAIVNIGSTGGIRPRPGLAWYNATKGAVHAATLTLAQELAADRIRVNAVCPVLGATGMLAQFLGNDDHEAKLSRAIAGIPLGRVSTPADIANACLFLAEESSSFVTGILLPVDGGRTA